MACSLAVGKDMAMADENERGQEKERNEWERKEGDKRLLLSAGQR